MIRKVLFIAVYITLVACGKNDLEDNIDYSAIPDQIYSIGSEELMQITRIPELNPFFTYDVAVYKVEYQTTYKNQNIVVSGVIALPVNAPNPALIAYSHGTLNDSGDAPSNVTDRPLTFTQLAATGYIVFAPDGIGFGSDTGRQDPWLISEPSAQALIDMVFAGKAFLNTNEIPYNDKLFLAGYSQGGNSTLAAQREIERASLDLNLVASAPGGGVYDMEFTFDRRVNGNNLEETLGVVYLLSAFISYYDWEPDFSPYLQEPYAGEFTALFQNEGFFVDKILTSSVLVQKISDGEFVQENVLLDSFIEDFNTNAANNFRLKLIENQLLNWAPQAPTTLFYGSEDTTSYFENSISAHSSFLEAGVDPEVIKLQGFSGEDHSGASSKWAVATVEYFNNFLNE